MSKTKAELYADIRGLEHEARENNGMMEDKVREIRDLNKKLTAVSWELTSSVRTREEYDEDIFAEEMFRQYMETEHKDSYAKCTQQSYERWRGIFKNGLILGRSQGVNSQRSKP